MSQICNFSFWPNQLQLLPSQVGYLRHLAGLELCPKQAFQPNLSIWWQFWGVHQPGCQCFVCFLTCHWPPAWPHSTTSFLQTLRTSECSSPLSQITSVFLFSPCFINSQAAWSVPDPIFDHSAQRPVQFYPLVCSVGPRKRYFWSGLSWCHTSNDGGIKDSLPAVEDFPAKGLTKAFATLPLNVPALLSSLSISSQVKCDVIHWVFKSNCKKLNWSFYCH